MSVLIKGITAKELLDVFEWARTGANNCMIGHGVIATELPDHGDLIEKEYVIGSACSGRIRALPTTEDGEDWIRVEEVRQSIKSAPVIIPAERSEE